MVHQDLRPHAADISAASRCTPVTGPAVAHWNLRPSEAIEVTVPRTVRRRSGVLVHSLALPTDEVTTLEGIPVTTVPRTIFDLASLGPRAVERTIHEAEHQQLTDSLSLAALVERYEHRRHSGVIKRVLSSYTAGQGITANEFEEAFDTFDTFLESRGFPAPEKNSWVQPGDRWIKGDSCAATENGAENRAVQGSRERCGRQAVSDR